MAKKGKRKKKQQKNYSTIKNHKHQGTKLISTLRQMPNLQPSSWMNDRLPDMLWAILLVKLLPRNQALNVFRLIIKYIGALPKDEKFGDITHTGLAKLPSKQLDDVLSIITFRQEHKQALTYLLALDELPAKEAWAKVLETEKTHSDWEPLMIAVAHTLDHQSQESTDCRWLRLMCAMVGYELMLPPAEIEGLIYYPNHGDLREVRPTIRSLEIICEEREKDEINVERLEWADEFWDECLRKTPCLSPNSNFIEANISAGTTEERLQEVWNLLVKHTHNTQTTTAVDAQHDTVFGIGLYCLGLLQRVTSYWNLPTQLAREKTLRTIAECYITLAYLAKKE